MEKINGRLLNWASILEDTTREQAERTAQMPFIYPHLALMPDAHLGKGATVGSVIPTDGAIIPAAVGVDIGCGMIGVRTSLTASDLPDDLSRLRSAIEGMMTSVSPWATGVSALFRWRTSSSLTVWASFTSKATTWPARFSQCGSDQARLSR